jgi:DinB superfamily
MNTPADVIAHSLTVSKNLLVRYVQDLSAEEYLHRPVPTANCVAWLLGHLTLTDRRGMSTTFGEENLPALPEGFDKKFSRSAGCPQAGEFGDVTNLLPLFLIHRDLLIDKVRVASPEELSADLEKPHPMFSTPGEMLSFISIHSAMHAGQITMIRRSLGRPPLT